MSRQASSAGIQDRSKLAQMVYPPHLGQRILERPFLEYSSKLEAESMGGSSH